MSTDILTKKIAGYFDGQDATVLDRVVKRKRPTLDQVRDAMIDVGNVLEEDLDHGIYVARVTGGRVRASGPIIAAAPCDEGVRLAGVVLRGAERPVIDAMGMFCDALDGRPPRRRRRHVRLRLFLVLILVAASLVALARLYVIPCVIVPAKDATERYNEAVGSFNTHVPGYNEIAKSLAVDNLRGFVTEAQELATQGTDYISICKSILGGNSADKIDADAITVRHMGEKLAKDEQVLRSITNPTGAWVSEKLRGAKEIDQVKAVTDDNDPNGMLGKEGGYSSCTYFTTRIFDSGAVKGSDPVEKGTDGGGSVEVYPTLEAARARCEYLSGFDGSILYSGSYALVGTMVVRTSCLLSDEAQYVLTNSIVESMANG